MHMLSPIIVEFFISFFPSLVGKTVIITGGTSGLGLETATELSLRGARIILVCR